VATFTIVSYCQQIAEHSAPVIPQSTRGRIPHSVFRIPQSILTPVTDNNKKAVLSQGNHTMPQLFFQLLCSLKFADNIHYKFKSSQAAIARLQSSKRTGAKQNLTKSGNLRSFKVTCLGVSGKSIRD